MSQKFKALVLFAFFASFLPAFAQSPGSGNDLHVNSPYSKVGIGDISPIGSIRNLGMAGVGVSSAHTEFVNSINPALLVNPRVNRYDSLFTILEGSVLGQTRKVSNSNVSQWSGNINFNSFAYAFPVNRRWTASVGLNPYSLVSYSTTTKQAIIGSTTDTATIENFGHGGIYQANLSNGFKLHKNLSLGIQVSYLFGAIHNESFSSVSSTVDAINVGVNQRSSYSGFLFKPGIAFRKKLQEGVHPDSALFLNAGFTYDFFGNVQTNERTIVQRKNQFNIIIDQSTTASSKVDVTMPSALRFGLSLDRFQKFNVGADFAYSDWSGYKVAGQTDTLKSSFSIAVGGEFLVNFRKEEGSSDKYNLKKNYIRAGVNYTQTPVYLNGKQINDVSLSVGYTLSVGNPKMNYSRFPLPKLNLALIVGQRGTHDSNLLKDVYFKAYVGLTINDKWFRRRRID